ncbi:MAG TPA: hypothetical protein VLL97_09050 [Acidobacteriota bacterium]|nr:hypothetical protein [Acidobacteriota bacterium]
MNRALLFLLFRGLKNRVILRLKMLRRPGYFLSVVAGAAYAYFLFFHHVIFGPPQTAAFPHAYNALPQGTAEAVFAMLLFMALVINFGFLRTPAPFFNSAEVNLLFSAPVTRSALIHYRLAKAQPGIVTATLISVIILTRFNIAGSAVYLAVAVWLLYVLLFLSRTIGAAAVNRKMLRAGILGLCGAAAASTAVWMDLRIFSTESRISLSAAIEEGMLSGPLYYLLYPFRLMVSPVFASDLFDFVVRVTPLLTAILLFYVGIRRSASLFEKAAIGNAASEKNRAAPASGLRGSLIAGKRSAHFSLFGLSRTGSAPAALCWKNMIMMGPLADRRVLAAFLLSVIPVIVIAVRAGEGMAMAVGSIAAAMVFFLALFGPVVFREDLRVGLKKADLLKTYPIPGWGVVLGETLAPIIILAILEGIMIMPAVALAPAPEGMNLSVADRAAVGLGAVLVVPFLSGIGVLIQNAAALLLPGWMHLGREHLQGVEAIGQRLIASIASLAALIAAATPAALIFLVVFFSGHWAVGLAIVPVAAAAAALFLLFEAGAAIVWMGRLFEKLDLSLHRQLPG